MPDGDPVHELKHVAQSDQFMWSVVIDGFPIIKKDVYVDSYNQS